MLSLYESAEYIALEAPLFESAYLSFPTSVPEADWRALVARVGPENPAEFLSEEAVPLRDGVRLLKPKGHWSAVPRTIAALAVAECGRERWRTPTPLGDFICELGVRPGELGEPSRSAWEGLWRTLGEQTVGPGSGLPWWLKQGYHGDWAALTSPKELQDLSRKLKVPDALERGYDYYLGKGYDVREILPPLIQFLHAAAEKGRWVLGAESAT